ncbi:DPY30 domain-containing protein 2 isoform X3 [Rousettus aegyptiacus]|uniref:DPY30 domain-containing protein 2 n=2 Tax=Rousettus aegyptiacus TaxID=9407 RepID=A0A7J8G6U5_ROUAE|nr:DPY30 domain-containing protein 2 isoform X3 [Rousettus aegyptiacus]KAF6455763.1 DPY30 domain containing 2 [Rousettus aegyptiacus]
MTPRTYCLNLGQRRALEKSPFEYHRMETDYLKRCFGNCLTQALAEVGKVRPSDPIEYLAHWLYHYRKITKAKEKDTQEKIQLKEEYDDNLEETKMTQILKREEYEIQQKYEKCHKPLISVASSTKKTIFKQENTKLLEKEALEQESLPGTSNMLSEIPQQFPSFDSSG